MWQRADGGELLGAVQGSRRSSGSVHGGRQFYDNARVASISPQRCARTPCQPLCGILRRGVASLCSRTRCFAWCFSL